VLTTPLKNFSPMSLTKKQKNFRRSQQHRRLGSLAYISLPTPENEKYAKIPSLGVKYTQLSSSQKKQKIIPENFSLLSPLLFTPIPMAYSGARGH
jgi:hypothetical protein